MRQLNAKEFSQEIGGDYFSLLTAILRGAPAGSTIADMEPVIPVIRKLRDGASEGFILLEEEEHRAVLRLVEAHQFGIRDEEIVTFRDNIRDAEKVEVTPDAGSTG